MRNVAEVIGARFWSARRRDAVSAETSGPCSYGDVQEKDTALDPDASASGPAGLLTPARRDPAPSPRSLPAGKPSAAHRVTVILPCCQTRSRFVYPPLAPPAVTVIPLAGTSTEAVPGPSDAPQARRATSSSTRVGRSGSSRSFVIALDNLGCFQIGRRFTPSPRDRGTRSARARAGPAPRSGRLREAETFTTTRLLSVTRHRIPAASPYVSSVAVAEMPIGPVRGAAT